MTTPLRLPPATPSLTKISAAFDRRLRARYPLPSFKAVPKKSRDAARRFWSQRAWSEYAALPVVSQILLKLTSSGAPLAELAAATAVLQDEALHTALSVQVAEGLGGYVEDIPDYLQLDVAGLSEPSSMPLALWLVMGCGIGETVSRALIQARLRATRVPEVRALMARTLRDENLHVAFGWTAMRRVLAALDADERARLAPWCASALRGAYQGASTALLRGRGLALERKQRSLVAEAGLGCCPPDEEDRAVRRCIRGFILPGLSKLGVEVDAEAEGL